MPDRHRAILPLLWRLVVALPLWLIGLAGLPDDLKTWNNWIGTTATVIDQNLARWFLFFVGWIVFSLLAMPRRSIGTTKAGKGRTVAEKERAQGAWSDVLVDRIKEGKDAKTTEQVALWKKHVFDTFDDYLVSPGPYKSRFTSLLGEGTERSVAYLKSLQRTLAEREIK